MQIGIELSSVLECQNKSNISNNNNKKNNINLNYPIRKFSTSVLNKNLNYPEEIDQQIEVDTDSTIEINQSKLAILHKQTIKDFKKAYGGGYLGYTHIHDFGNVTQFYSSSEHFLHFIDKLILKLKEYINEIPENIIYSILPVLRWQFADGEYRSLTITESIKITRNISLKLLAEKLLWDIGETLLNYDLKDADLELFMMGRPWLSIDEFDLERFLTRLSLTDLFENQIEKKISALSESSLQPSKNNSKKNLRT